jgi:hypothetical protein
MQYNVQPTLTDALLEFAARKIEINLSANF